MAAAYSRSTLNPVQEVMHSVAGITDNQLALLQGPAIAWPLALAAVPMGILIDRYRRVRLLKVFTIVAAAGTVLTAFSSTFPCLLVVRCFIAMAICGTNPTALSLLSDLYAPAERGRATMTMAVGGYAGAAGAFALGGSLIAASNGGGLNALRDVLLEMSVPLIVIAILSASLQEPARRDVGIHNYSVRQAVAEVWRYRAVILPPLVGMVLAEIGMNGVLVWGGPALSRTFHLAADRVGFIMAVTVLFSGILGPVMGGVLADLCHRGGGPHRTLRMLSILTFASAPGAFFPLVQQATVASVLLLAFITIISAVIVSGTTLFTVVIPNEIRGLCITAMIAASVLFGIGLAPLMVSLLSSLLDGPAPLGKALVIVSAATAVLAAVVFGFGSRLLSDKAVTH